MSGINQQMEYLQTIVEEFSGTEFTTEDLMNKTFSSKEGISCDVWLSKDKFSIIHVEGYPELSNEEYRMVTEILDLHGYINCGCFQGSEFTQDLKVNRKNKTILQWYTSFFPTEEQDNEFALEYFNELKRIRLFYPRRCAIWSELYDNEEYCNKIMEKDIETNKKYREDKIRHLQGLENEPINPHEYAFSLRHEGEIFNYYGLNTPTPDDNSD